MSNPKRDKPRSNHVVRPREGLFARLGSGPGRWLLVGVVLCAALGGGGYAAWRTLGPRILASPHFRITSERITISPPPHWIKADIREEVLRGGSLDGSLSILDDTLAERIAKAFALHPWVAKVERVTKRAPGEIDVELVYRRPACMIDVPGGVLPVDGTGVLLPRDDFSTTEASRYPRLTGIVTLPAGSVGMPWGDLQVAAGAELAALLGDAWSELKLHTIGIVAAAGGGFTLDVYARPTTDGRPGTRIVWGSPIGLLAPGEATPGDKLALLKQFAQDHGGLTSVDAPLELDLRLAPAVSTTPRTAAASGPEANPGGQRR